MFIKGWFNLKVLTIIDHAHSKTHNAAKAARIVPSVDAIIQRQIRAGKALKTIQYTHRLYIQTSYSTYVVHPQFSMEVPCGSIFPGSTNKKN